MQGNTLLKFNTALRFNCKVFLSFVFKCLFFNNLNINEL